MEAKRLSEGEWEGRARPAVDAIFKSLNVKEEPFRDSVEKKLIIDVGGFFLDEEQFRAVCLAAETAGDTSLLYSIVRGYLGGPELIAHYTWELTLYEYEDYYNSDEGCWKGAPVDIGIPLDRVMYSPSGEWGVLLPELFAVVGGTTAFVERFKAGYPGWAPDCAQFVKQFEEGARLRRVDVAWVPVLLRHVYGENAPVFAP